MGEQRGPIRVLVVDDEKPLQELLKCSLEAFGLSVAGVANNGEEALSEYDRLKPDAVVMDIRMPVMDGITALTKLKAAHPESVVLMITANQEEAQRQEALKLGANGFLHKPFRVDELFADIQRAFRSVLARKSEQPLDDQYVRYVLNAGKADSAPRPSQHITQTSTQPPNPEVQFLDAPVTTSRPSGPVAVPAQALQLPPDQEIARLKKENRELREQVQAARDTASKLLEVLNRALTSKN